MSKTTIGFLVGAGFALLGIVLALQASSLGTRWEMIGPNAWGGTTDPARVQAYRLIGVVISGFGLIIVAVSFHWWLREGRGVVQDEFDIKGRGFFQ